MFVSSALITLFWRRYRVYRIIHRLRREFLYSHSIKRYFRLSQWFSYTSASSGSSTLAFDSTGHMSVRSDRIMLSAHFQSYLLPPLDFLNAFQVIQCNPFPLSHRRSPSFQTSVRPVLCPTTKAASLGWRRPRRAARPSTFLKLPTLEPPPRPHRCEAQSATRCGAKIFTDRWTRALPMGRCARRAFVRPAPILPCARAGSSTSAARRR